ncbi:28S Ribosomal Protein S27 [Manis pentadactyla]|nr:28S Ribosomal Protein S27 [Manis pentadactyla]
MQMTLQSAEQRISILSAPGQLISLWKARTTVKLTSFYHTPACWYERTGGLYMLVFEEEDFRGHGGLREKPKRGSTEH